MFTLDGFVERLLAATPKAISGQRQAVLRALQPELLSTLRRVKEIKNLLYRSKSAQLEEIFVEPILRRDDVEITAGRLLDRFYNNERIIVRGLAGFGKSVLLKHYCLCHVKENFSFAPLFLELRRIDPASSGSLVKALHDAYGGLQGSLSEDDLEKAIANRTFSVILDGFDEVSPESRGGP